MTKVRIVKYVGLTMFFIVVALISRSEVITFMYLTDTAPENKNLSIPDLWIGTFSNIRLVMYFLLPVSFSLYISNFLSIGFESTMLEYTLLRYDSRRHYLRVKLSGLFLRVVFYLTHLSLTSVVIWVLLGHSFALENYHYIFTYNSLANIPISQLYSVFIIKIIAGLFFIGVINLVLFLVTKNKVLPMILIFIFSFFQGTLYLYVMNDVLLAWLPFSQFIHGTTVDYTPFGFNVSYYSTLFQLSYLIVGTALAIIAATFLFSHADISQDKNKGDN
ncbi:MAG: hypothetical protein JJU16_00835 [Alkalibacterium sp.]|nr:hypothetical protein [Alkalibacterium sp.]